MKALFPIILVLLAPACRTTQDEGSVKSDGAQGISGGSSVTGFNANGQKVTLPAPSADQACIQGLSQFRAQCDKQGGQAITAENCIELCSIKVNGAGGSSVTGYNAN